MQGGRGRGFGDFDDRPPPSFGPDREAPLGSAARPGQQVSLQTSGESTITVERAYAGFPEALQVQQIMLQYKCVQWHACSLHYCQESCAKVISISPFISMWHAGLWKHAMPEAAWFWDSRPPDHAAVSKPFFCGVPAEAGRYIWRSADCTNLPAASHLGNDQDALIWSSST